MAASEGPTADGRHWSTDSYTVAGGPDRVDAWTDFRLPFEPRDEKKQCRTELRAALELLTVPAGQLLAAVYASDDLSFCDAENVLLYNVGMSAFREHMHTGLQIERAFSAAPSPEAIARKHHHAYFGIAPHDGFQHWKVRGVLAKAAAVPQPGTLGKPAAWWAAVAGAPLTSNGATEGPFALEVVWRPPLSRRPQLHTALKPMLDGVIAALHSHDGSAIEVIADLLARPTGLGRSQIQQMLMPEREAPLGRRRLLSPYRNFVQWNPADDRCVAARVVLGEPQALGELAIRLLDVEPPAVDSAGVG